VRVRVAYKTALSINIYDIAKSAGVSIATVSRVFNNNTNVSPKTRQKILDVAESMGYHPRAFAQGLARRNTKTIILIVPILSNYYFMEILAGMQDKLLEYDYDLNIYNIKGFESVEELRHQVEYVMKKGLADGYALVSVHLPESDWESMLRFRTPVVLVDEFSPKFDSVSVDSIEGAYTATKFLIDSGCRCVAMISAVETSKPIRDRIHGYKRALEDSGRLVDADLIICGDDTYRDGFTEQAGYAAMMKILNHPSKPDSCFCASDIQALGALKAMRDAGKEIPIIGFDDIQISRFLGLSTMRQPMYEMGSMALDKLMDRIENPNRMVSHTVFSPELILRTSTTVLNQATETAQP
jgi:LacI family transcriptional regulator